MTNITCGLSAASETGNLYRPLRSPAGRRETAEEYALPFTLRQVLIAFTECAGVGVPPYTECVEMELAIDSSGEWRNVRMRVVVTARPVRLVTH